MTIPVGDSEFPPEVKAITRALAQGAPEIVAVIKARKEELSPAPAPRALDYNTLREHLEQSAATEQSLGDDYSESPGKTALEQAHWHWGRADALRSVIGHVERDAGESR